MSVLAFCKSLYDSPIGTQIRESDNLFSAIETVHVLGIVCVAGIIAIADFRLLGLALKQVPVPQVLDPLVRTAWIGFAVMLVSGALLFWSEAEKLYGNPAFRLKLILLALAAGNAGLFHATTYRSVAVWGAAPTIPGRARVAAVCSLALWGAIIACGRAIAYQ